METNQLIFLNDGLVFLKVVILCGLAKNWPDRLIYGQGGVSRSNDIQLSHTFSHSWWLWTSHLGRELWLYCSLFVQVGQNFRAHGLLTTTSCIQILLLKGQWVIAVALDECPLLPDWVVDIFITVYSCHKPRRTQSGSQEFWRICIYWLYQNVRIVKVRHIS